MLISLTEKAFCVKITLPKHETRVVKVDFKSKMSNFFYYHKVHIAVVIFAIICAGLTFRQCSSIEPADISIIYACSETAGNETADFLEDAIENTGLVPDIDENGVVTASAFALYTPDHIKGGQDVQAYNKIFVEMIEGDNAIYLIDKRFIIEETYGALMPIDYLAEGILEDELIRNENGQVIAIDVSDSAFFEGTKVPSKGIYIALSSVALTDKSSAEYKCAHDLAKHIVTGK